MQFYNKKSAKQASVSPNHVRLGESVTLAGPQRDDGFLLRARDGSSLLFFHTGALSETASKGPGMCLEWVAMRVFTISVSSLWSCLLLHQQLLPSWPISGYWREEQTCINAPRGFVVTTDQSIFFESQTFSIFNHEKIARKHCHSQLMSADKYH